jgi:hypothetical protein
VDRDKEKRKLQHLQEIANRMAGDVWHMEADGDGIHLISQRATGEEVRILTLYPDASADEQDLVAGALDHLFLFLGFFGRAVEKVRELREQLARLTTKKRAENFGFQAKSLCEKTAFWRFLEGKGAGGRIASAQAADTRMKFLLNIKSKSELNDDLVARERFQKLRSDFYSWQRGDAP